jgi:hypothetical protein
VNHLGTRVVASDASRRRSGNDRRKRRRPPLEVLAEEQAEDVETVGGTQGEGGGDGRGRRNDDAQGSEVSPAEQHVELKPVEEVGERGTRLLYPLG